MMNQLVANQLIESSFLELKLAVLKWQFTNFKPSVAQNRGRASQNGGYIWVKIFKNGRHPLKNFK